VTTELTVVLPPKHIVEGIADVVAVRISTVKVTEPDAVHPFAEVAVTE